jgi:hypothetical protein
LLKIVGINTGTVLPRYVGSEKNISKFEKYAKELKRILFSFLYLVNLQFIVAKEARDIKNALNTAQDLHKYLNVQIVVYSFLAYPSS